VKAYLIDEDQMQKLKLLYSALNGGTDRESDYGTRLWLICKQAKNNVIHYTYDKQEKENETRPYGKPPLLRK